MNEHCLYLKNNFDQIGIRVLHGEKNMSMDFVYEQARKLELGTEIRSENRD
jgi:hypothetical protein